MTKTKIFEQHSDTLEDFQKKVNEFLKHLNVVDVKYNSFLVPGIGVEHTVLVIYKVNREEL